jgi:hypothetical protein
VNEQLSNALAEVLKASKDGVVSVALFAQQQAPDLAREIVQWGFWSHLLWSVLSPMIVFSLYLINIKVMALYEKDKGERNYSDAVLAVCWLFWIIGGIVAIIFIINTFCAIETVIKCAVAPKLYLMDYIKEFLTPKGK